MDKTSDSKSTYIKIARVLMYLVYTYAIIATVFLVLGFVLLLFGANSASGFVNFVYGIAIQFLKPFREIFPTQPIGNKGYFSASGLFAIVIYGIAAMALHSLITYITVKQSKHQAELDEYMESHKTMQERSQVHSTDAVNPSSGHRSTKPAHLVS